MASSGEINEPHVGIEVTSEIPSSSKEQHNKKNKSENKTTETEEQTKDYHYGYHLFPERRGERYKPSWKNILLHGEGRETYDRIRCERKVFECTQTSPLVKLLFSALKSSGCDVKLNRHISCEVCDKRVSGGYDPELNQIVICQNVARHKEAVQGVLAHELIHMFDFCRAKLDFKNLKHLACTEIRAANLVHCSFMGAWAEGTASPFNVAKRHAECVKKKAIASVIAVRNVTEEQAREVVDSVFDKCYNDLEPIGRRIRRSSYDMHKAYQERYYYGYGD